MVALFIKCYFVFHDVDHPMIITILVHLLIVVS